MLEGFVVVKMFSALLPDAFITYYCHATMVVQLVRSLCDTKQESPG